MLIEGGKISVQMYPYTVMTGALLREQGREISGGFEACSGGREAGFKNGVKTVPSSHKSSGSSASANSNAKFLPET